MALKTTTALLLLLWGGRLVAQAPSGYYDGATGKRGTELKAALHDIIDEHTSISYSQIWYAFWSTDNKGNGVVWDMYSDVPNGTPPYTYQIGQNQCGSYNNEGDCYNREHSWPQSWFSDQATPRTDLHHIFPTDGYVNSRRSNYPFGEVQNASWTSQNGSKLGTCKSSLGYSGTVFEPIDEYKGDFARALMYMSVRYYGEDASWGTSGMTNKSEILPWAIAMLLSWNEQDPVSQKEIDRNNAIYNNYQHNRNPFIDHPEYARMIWDPNWVGTTYNITCVTGLQHGSISAPATAFVGSTVTLTATPETGYMLDTWTVYKTSAPSTTVTVTDNTFIMPDYDVTVSATFKVNTTLYNITCATGLSHGSIGANPNSAMSGTTITLSNTPDSGYSLYSYYVYKTGDINTIVYSGTGNTFTMPAFDVTVSASFSQATGGDYEKVTSALSDWSGEYILVYEDSSTQGYVWTGVDEANCYVSRTIANNTIADDSFVTLIIAPMTGGYSIKVNGGTNNGKYISGKTTDNVVNFGTTAALNTLELENDGVKITSNRVMRFNDNKNNGMRFRYYSASSLQPVQLYKKTTGAASTPTHTIQFNSNDGIQSSYTQTVNEFEPTALQANTFTRDGYAFDSWNTAPNGSGTTYFDGATVTLLNDLTLYAQWDPTYSITCATGEHGSISASATEAVEGDIITLTATPTDGYDLDYWVVTTATNEPVDVEGNQFVMPAGAVTVRAVFGSFVQDYVQKYYLVTDVSQLVEGRTYLVVCTSKNKALGPQSGNVRLSKDVAISNGSIAVINGASELTLGSSNGFWTLSDGTAFLCAASNTNNQLVTQTVLDNNGRWSIDINENAEAVIVAQGEFTHRILRYSIGSNHFSCFDSGATAVSLLVRSEELDYTESATVACLNTFDKTTIRSGATLTATTVLGATMCNKTSQIILEDGAQLMHNVADINATVKKTITAYEGNGGWYTLSAPFASLEPTDANGLLTANYDLYAYDEDGDSEGKEWINYEANSFYITSGNGYLYANSVSRSLRMGGALNSGSYTQTVDLGYANSEANIKGFNLLGNPTAHDISFTTTESVSDGYYYLDNSEAWVYTPSNTVPVGRGFLVKANATGQSVTLNPQSRGNGDKGQYLRLSVGDAKVYVKMNEGVSMPLVDLRGSHAELYLVRDRQPYAMLVRDDATALDLCFEPHRNGIHTLEVDTEGLALDYLHLVDHLTGADIDLLSVPEPVEGPKASYTFTARTTDYPSRFQLVFSASQAPEPIEGSSNFAYYDANGQLVVVCKGEAVLQMVDVLGRVVATERIAGQGEAGSRLAATTPGVYVLRLITADAVRTQRLVVR